MKKPELLVWLEQVGDLEHVKDRVAIAALEKIYARVTGERENLKPRYRDEDYDAFWMIRVHVGGFLKHAARIAEKDASNAREQILRRSVARMKSETSPATGLPHLEHAFVVRAVIPAAGDARLEIVRPVGATPEFCVRYAMWLVALEVPVKKWRRYKLRTCDRDGCAKGVDGGPMKFYDTRWVMKHGPRSYCSHECQVKRNN